MLSNQTGSKTDESKNPSPDLLGYSDARSYVRDRIKGSRYWILILADQWAWDIAREIEDQFYFGEDSQGRNKNDDLEVLMTADGLMTLVLVKKSRMNAKQLANIINHTGSLRLTRRDLEKRDIIFLARDGRLSDAMKSSFLMWMKGFDPRNN